MQPLQTILKLNLIFLQIEVNVTQFITEIRFFFKFNLLLVSVVLAAYTITSYLVWAELSSSAEKDVLDKARVMLETAKAMRTYTTDQIAPLLDREEAQVERSSKDAETMLNVRIPDALTKAIAQLPTPREQQALQTAEQRILANARERSQDQPAKEFLPQSIPFFAATEAFKYFREQYPEYSYKEAALNPTNPRDRTSDWEIDVVNMFQRDSAKKEFSGRRETPEGHMLYVTTPIRIDDNSCLGCHGVASDAPPELVRRYGPNNGFGWSLNDVVGAQIVSIPARVAEVRALAAQKAIMSWLAVVFLALWVLVNALVYAFYKLNAFARPSSASPVAAYWA